jgi:hypothetical protein
MRALARTPVSAAGGAGLAHRQWHDGGAGLRWRVVALPCADVVTA